MTVRATPILWALMAAALFGASTPLTKGLLNDLGPLSLAGLLYIGAALAVVPFALRAGGFKVIGSRANILRLAGAVLFGGVLGPVLLLLGLKAAPAASVSLWLNLETVATSVLAWVLFREHIGRRTALAAGLVVLSGVLLAAPLGFGHAASAVLVGLACLCWGLDNNLTSLIDGFTPAQSTVIKGLAAGAVNLGLGLWLESGVGDWGLGGRALVIGAFAYGVSIMLYVSSAQQLGASRSQMVFSTAPFIGVGLAWGLLGEGIQAMQVVAGVVMAVALSLIVTARHEHPHRHTAMTHTHSHRHDDGHHAHSHPGLPVSAQHTHPHAHEALIHAHGHEPDLHHRHNHEDQAGG